MAKRSPALITIRVKHCMTNLPILPLTGQTIGPLTVQSIIATALSHKVTVRMKLSVARSTSPFVRPFPVKSAGGARTAQPVWR